MAGGCHRCFTCFFTCTSVLLLWVCLHDVEASSCQHVIHKKVGDSVELSSCSPTEGVTEARWKYGRVIIADKNKNRSKQQFTGRLYLNPTDFSLTVRGLTLQDSGNFSFLSETGDQQRPTVIISLQVHEPITKQPVLTSNSTWHTLNESCTVLLECSATTDSSVSYNWTVRNQTRSGSRLQYIIRPQDGDTNFTCTIYNAVSEMSAFKIVKCSNNTEGKDQKSVLLMGASIGGCMIVVIALGIAVGVCYYKRGQQAGSDSNDLTVYADISEVAVEGETAATMKPCSVYETIDNRVNSRTPGPETVYDKIQFSRMRKASVSPYQEIS
ncbi:CD48 antigen-like [Chaetodon trifascialis]|uniref:CD48 antigen-like n=1 Tax=Chaetodon trifascialis TaxID=109706 RepID=UPI00399132C9